MLIRELLLIHFFLFVLSPTIFDITSQAQNNRQFSFGLHFGLSDHNYGKDFSQAEGELTCTPPFRLFINNNIQIALEANFNLGFMRYNKRNGARMSFGPRISFIFRDNLLAIHFSSMPGFITRDIYDEFSIGGKFHFLSQAGISYRISEKFGIEYLFEHISNGGIERPNPGVNFHMFGLRIYPE